MATALYPGTFDPITLGHIDIAKRASQIFSKVVTVVADNKSKNCLFSVEERLELAKESLKEFPTIEVISYDGLVIDAVKEYEASTIIRGLRALSDFDYEFQLAFTNRQLDDKADTVFLMPSVQFTYLSSSMVRQLAQFEGEISQFVTPSVESALKERFL